ncbi:sister chromatid cohesion protein PDS5 homolog B isoform X1 [Rhagoletis pomonella]|uniref:sister chromatid cohesion protein PDS5 homolog B isoform X1 n=1 Tax=Rhagoletis pomonella TaxID=28610 RepID=UPI00177F1DA2|nr:sister chromatid cohesion protein PDS5 homolog B isoform X1 [Rhagoletis pomonella]XP_036333196.1 sister chromatid cohesion protein PDS5 homolog B isoform X1 [Rhagoletis pomonella]XP_036333197.1 sister chromatid cohesion protein PDS5 homolog B isoform X1 [Rhagoletis pomonella]
MAEVKYPAGCRPLTEDLGTDELIRRLKTLAHALQAMGQDEKHLHDYIQLALVLVDDYFLQHQSRDVQLLVACCIADILRVFAPEAPYKDQDQIKTIFMFFIKQLHGLKDPKDASFKRYFYLLENLAFVKSFNMCFEIEDCQKIFCQLFAMMFKIINKYYICSENHSTKVKNFMIDIMSPLITEADNVTTPLLDLILINIVEPLKSNNVHSYQLAEQLIQKTSYALEPIIKIFFNQVLILGKIDKNIAITAKIYDLIYELNQISPNLMCSVLPQLECKLKSTNEIERMKAVSLLARMFSEKDSQLSKKHTSLLRMLLGRFCDIASAIRVKCVQSSMHFLLNHPHLRNDIIECLRARQHDSDETVRYEVVMAIVATAKREFNIVCESQDLLHIVRERTLDKKFKIRKEAMNGLAFIYKGVKCEPNDLSSEVKESVGWIKNKILHGYYMPGIEDRLLVERLLITCLVPYKLPPDERMKMLYHLLGTLDDNAMKAFMEIQKNQMKTRKTVSDWVKMHHTKELTQKMLNQHNVKQALICKLLPDPLKASEYIAKFSINMRKDGTLLRYMEIILKRDVSCKECADTMSLLLKKLGNPMTANLYYNTVKMLIERVASVMVDKESIGILISLIDQCMQRGKIVEEVGIPSDEAGERGLKFLCMLSYIFSAHFFTDETLQHMIALLSHEEDYAAPLILKALVHLGRYHPLCDINPAIVAALASICKDFALTGTVKQAKHAVRCIFVNVQTQTIGGTDAGADTISPPTKTPIIHPIFNEIIETLRVTLSPRDPYQHTKICTLGHIAYHMPQAFLTPVKNMIARRVVKELLIQGVSETRDCILPAGDWCDKEGLPADTLCKLDALKTMARWLIGLRSDEHAAQKTFRMLVAFINQRGDLLEQNRLCPAEKSWLRLSAACAMLKICEQKGVGDQYNAEQFFNLSQVMCDPVPEVRDMFARKLHKGLGKGLPNKCLPLDFMGYYALVGHETDKRLTEVIRNYVEIDVNKRREYLKTLATMSTETKNDAQTAYILPDFMLAFAIPVLAHDPTFTDYEDRNQLKQVEKCLRFILEPLMAKREAFSYSFYTNLIQMMKNHQDTTPNAEDHAYNFKMWAACDLALYIINSKIGDGSSSANSFSVQIQLPEMYYKPLDKPGNDLKVYIPLDTYTLASSPISGTTKINTSAAVSTVVKKFGTPAASSTTMRLVGEKRAADHLPSNENSPTNSQDNTVTYEESKVESNASSIAEPAAKRTRGPLRVGKTVS